MDWATNPAGEHVLAGTPGALGYGLRCPVCKAHVYHRNGIYNRPHFAHYSSNFNRACELYHPGIHTGAGSFERDLSSPSCFLQPFGFEAPALVWTEDELFSLSLQLRLPKLTRGYSSTLTVTSSMGTSVYIGEQLSRSKFVVLPLREPPAEVKLTPPDPAMDLRLKAVLGQFRLSGNFFRTTANGGVLESPEAPLELGAEYLYVTQRPLPEPYPSALKVGDRRQQRSWFVYRVILRDTPSTRSGDISVLGFYLNRRILPPKPGVEVVWPPAFRFDEDGTAILSETTKSLIVLTNDGPPKAETTDRTEVSVNHLGECHYQITFSMPVTEVVVWIPSGAYRRLRFEKRLQATPRGVLLTGLGGAADLTSVIAKEFAGQSGAIEITVPSERLWRKARLNGNKLSPLPNGERFMLDGPFHDIRFGAFGSIVVAQQGCSNGDSVSLWHTRIERLVAGSIGLAALEELKTIHSKHDVIRWAIKANATHLLPLVLSAFSTEVGRGFP